MMHGHMNVELVRLTSISSRGGVIRGAHSINMHHVIKNRLVQQRKHDGVLKIM
jgi:hypothetical protein